jgi:hypothetical protein
MYETAWDTIPQVSLGDVGTPVASLVGDIIAGPVIFKRVIAWEIDSPFSLNAPTLKSAGRELTELMKAYALVVDAILLASWFM